MEDSESHNLGGTLEKSHLREQDAVCNGDAGNLGGVSGLDTYAVSMKYDMILGSSDQTVSVMWFADGRPQVPWAIFQMTALKVSDQVCSENEGSEEKTAQPLGQKRM